MPTDQENFQPENSKLSPTGKCALREDSAYQSFGSSDMAANQIISQSQADGAAFEELNQMFTESLTEEAFTENDSGFSTSVNSQGFTTYHCPFCSYQHQVKSYMSSHVRAHVTSGKKYTCPECPYISPKLSNIRAHLRVHSKDKPYVCGLCLKSFTMHHHLHSHLNTHKARNELPPEDSQLVLCVHCHQSAAVTN